MVVSKVTASKFEELYSRLDKKDEINGVYCLVNLYGKRNENQRFD